MFLTSFRSLYLFLIFMFLTCFRFLYLFLILCLSLVPFLIFVSYFYVSHLFPFFIFVSYFYVSHLFPSFFLCLSLVPFSPFKSVGAFFVSRDRTSFDGLDAFQTPIRSVESFLALLAKNKTQLQLHF